MTKQLVLIKNIVQSNYKRLDFPYKLTFVVTYKCQSKCVVCSIWKKKPQNELTLDEIEKFFKKSNKFSWIDVTGGEIFLRSDIVDIFRIIIENCRNLYHIHSPTNGLMPSLTEERVKKILELKPNRFVVTVSLDGPKELNDYLRGVKGDFDKVIETVKRLKKVEDKNFKVVIGFTLSKLNKGTFQKMVEEVKKEIPEMKNEDFHMNIVHSSSHYYDNKEVDVAKNELKEDIKNFRDSRRDKFTPIGFLEHRYLKMADRYLETGKTPVTCQALAGSVFLDSFGDIYPCTIYSKKMANIREIDFDLEKYWQEEAVKTLRKEIEEGKCPHCWTPCEAYQSILANLGNFRHT